jgi:predicted permease
MASLTQDLRFAFRILRRSPAFTSVAVLSLGLGIGANTAIFTVMDALLLRNLPVKQPKQLVIFGQGKMSGINDDFPSGKSELFSQPFYLVVRVQNQVFSDVAAMESMHADGHARIGGASAEPEPVKIRLVSGNYFAMLGVGASVGRVLGPEDDQTRGGHPVAVMSHAFWERRFGRDAGVVGRTLTFNDTAYTIIGVAAREFFGTVVGESQDFWIPHSMQAQAQPWKADWWRPREQSLWLMGRRKPGVSVAAAQANTNVLYQQWLREIAGASPSPELLQDMRKAQVDLTEAATGFSRLRDRFSHPLEILMVVVGLVLLIACCNIANLLLARAAGRQREIAVRLALGAERRRLVRQLLSESLVLAMMGGALGVLIAWWGGQLLVSMVESGPDPLPLDVGPNPRALLFTFGISLLTGLLFGIAPALRMTGGGVGPALKEGKGTAGRSRSRSRMGQGLVVGQVALALFLMVGAGLFIRTLEKTEQIDVGFDKDKVVLARLDRDSSRLKGPALISVSRLQEARVRALPGVKAASFCWMNFNDGRWSTPVWPEGVAHTRANAKSSDGNRVGAQYFEVLGVPIVMGRSFVPQDTQQSNRVAVVNETLARRLYPEGSPLGRHLWLGGNVEIVGIVKDAKYGSLREKPRGMFFVHNEQEQDSDGYDSLVVRVAGKPEAVMSQIRAALRSEDPNLAITEVTTLGEIVERSLGREKLLAKLAGFFGALALLLASIGLYGVIAYSVARRRNEIGIRMALGARPGSVLRMMLGESLVVVALGLAVGIPAALACGRLVSSLLYGVKAYDPLTIGGAAALLLAVALAASFLPARRAALLDPCAALREE